MRLKDKKSMKTSQKKRWRYFVIDESEDFHSTILFLMKRQSKWVVTVGENLKSKQHKVVTIKQAFENERNE